jgi:hypothetical protein
MLGCPSWVKTGRTQNEDIFSVLLPTADITPWPDLPHALGTSKTADLPARPPLPSPGVQPLLLVGQGTPCRFHSHEGSPAFLVLGSFGQEGAISSIIAIKIS